jgi:hypothetical protein
MRNEWVRRNKWIFVAAPAAFAFFVWLCGQVVMHLWNWLLPMIFGVHTITFWQALGLVLLSRILFGRWGHGHDRGRRNHFDGDKWKNWTPEEREKFRREMRERWCERGEPETEISEPSQQ